MSSVMSGQIICRLCLSQILPLIRAMCEKRQQVRLSGCYQVVAWKLLVRKRQTATIWWGSRFDCRCHGIRSVPSAAWQQKLLWVAGQLLAAAASGFYARQLQMHQLCWWQVRYQSSWKPERWRKKTYTSKMKEYKAGDSLTVPEWRGFV